MKATVDARALAGMLSALRLGDARFGKEKKEDVVGVTLCAVNNRVRISLTMFDSVLTEYDSAAKKWEFDAAQYPVTAEIDAVEVNAEGACKLKFGEVQKITNFCGGKGADVELEAAGASLTVRRGSRTARVVCAQGTSVSFPNINDGVHVPLSEVLSVIGSYSAPTDILNNFWQWVSVESSVKGTRIVWTDGAQLKIRACDPDFPRERVLIPLFALRCLAAFKPGDDLTVAPDGIACGGVVVRYCAQKPSGYSLVVVKILSKMMFSAAFPPTGQTVENLCVTEMVKTTCEALSGMLKQLASCTNDELVISAGDGKIRMLAYDDRTPGHPSTPLKRWEDCPRAETWCAAETDGGFSGVTVNPKRLKQILGSWKGPVTLRVSDKASPILIDIENSGIQTVLMPLRASFDKTTID